MNVIALVLFMVFAAIVLGAYAAVLFVAGRKEDAEARVQNRLGITKEEEDDVLASLLKEQAADTMIDRLGAWGRKTQDTLNAAALELSVTELVGQMVAASLLVALIMIVLTGPQGLPAAIVAGYLPLRRVNNLATKRAKELLTQMPDALEMMSRAMQTGAGLVDCFRLVSVELKDPVAFEFGRIADEVRYGKDWRLALEGLIKRNPTLFDLRLLVSSLLLQRETGGNMIETLARISRLIRARASFDAKVRAMTSEARASGTILALMPVGVMLLVLVANPPYLEPLISTAAGQMAVVGGLCMYGSGLFLMQQMQKVDA